MAPKKRGRPPGPRSKLRHNRVNVLISDSERRRLAAWAREEGKAIGTLARDLVLAALEREGR